MAERLVGLPRERDTIRLAERVGTSERRILGWEPAERHEHYDAEGNLTGVTIVRRESEWDDMTRTRHLALAEYDADVHSGGCGLHDSIARTDPHTRLEDYVCPACASLDIATRTRDELEREDEKDYPAERRRASDGRRSWLRVLTPAEVAALPKS